MGRRNGLGILEMKEYLDTAESRTFGCLASSAVTVVTVLSHKETEKPVLLPLIFMSVRAM